jgi:formamidopyrimidine-DNA glycosylase
MPELPEVETTRLGIQLAIEHHDITAVRIHNARLRWPVPTELSQLVGQRIETIHRRGKYLIFSTAKGYMLLHLGMSGSLRLAKASEPLRRHDHVEFDSDSGWTLRFHDPRRFGCVLWFTHAPEEHPLLATLGPEPLTDDFSGHYLFQHSRGRSAPIKSFLMDSHVVVGVGNIYANEALFHAGIHPLRAAGRISEARYEQLAIAIRQILDKAITQGGTTLRDFVNSRGEPGYFQQELDVYGRSGLPCHHCLTVLKEVRLSGRSTVYCPQCQR